MYELKELPVMKTQMLIRKTPHEVFEAFSKPEITSKFWFTKGSAQLKPGTTVIWTWGMYDMTAMVRVKTVELDHSIVIEWGDESRPTNVEWRFSPCQNSATFVVITEKGYSGSGDEVVAHALGSMGGFSFLLSGAKAYLEYGIELALSADHAPEGLE